MPMTPDPAAKYRPLAPEALDDRRWPGAASMKAVLSGHQRAGISLEHRTAAAA